MIFELVTFEVSDEKIVLPDTDSDDFYYKINTTNPIILTAMINKIQEIEKKRIQQVKNYVVYSKEPLFMKKFPIECKNKDLLKELPFDSLYETLRYKPYNFPFKVGVKQGLRCFIVTVNNKYIAHVWTWFDKKVVKVIGIRSSIENIIGKLCGKSYSKIAVFLFNSIITWAKQIPDIESIEVNPLPNVAYILKKYMNFDTVDGKKYTYELIDADYKGL
jgi:hypothetical protein